MCSCTCCKREVAGRPMSIRARLFIGATAALGVWALAHALWHWQSVDLTRFVCYLLVAVLASSLKVQLPGIDGTMSVNFLFILLSVLELNLPETLVLGCTATLAQCLFGTRQKLVPIKIVFNVFGMMANAIAVSYFAYHSLQRVLGAGTLPLLVITALIFFVANTVPVAMVISLTEGKPAHKVWADCHFWSFPFYMVGAAVVFAVGFVSKQVGWQTSLLVLPLVYWVYRSYHLYLAKLADEKKQVEIEKGNAEEVALLHLRTIESLALAIEAKDHTSHKHLKRIRVFAVEVAKELGFPEDEIEALRAAALLHDIGKLAIPEHIINKPGRLTPEEFEKMKIHTLVGAEILQRVAFPYPVATRCRISAPTSVWIFIFSNSSGVRRPGLLMMCSGIASLPMSCSSAAARRASISSSGKPNSFATSTANTRTRFRCLCEVWSFASMASARDSMVRKCSKATSSAFPFSISTGFFSSASLAR